VWVSVRLVAVTITLSFPVGVPGFAVPPALPPPLLPPPPQPPIASKVANAVIANTFLRRRGLDGIPKRKIPGSNAVVASQKERA
jgi:hypothetical protein